MLNHLYRTSRNLSCIIKRYYCSDTISAFNLLEKGKHLLFEKRDFISASKTLSKIVESKQMNSDLNYEAELYLGLAEKENGENKKSFQHFTNIISSIKPSCKYSHMGIAEYYHANSNYKQALKKILQVLRLDPNYNRAKIILSDILLYHYDQYELSASHATSAFYNSKENFHLGQKFNLLSDVENDACVLNTIDIPNIPLSNILMNCPSLLYKNNNDYNDETTFYRQIMDNKPELYKDPYVHVDEYANLNVMLPNATKISPIKADSTELVENITVSAETSLNNLITFAEQTNGSDNITVIYSDLYTVLPAPEEPIIKSINGDTTDKWLGVCKSINFHDHNFEVSPKDLKFPLDWKVYAEGTLLRSGNYIYSAINNITPLLKPSLTFKNSSTIPGILASNLAYIGKNNESSDVFYHPNFCPPKKNKGYVELPLLEKILCDIWNSKGVIIIGDITKYKPWVDIIHVLGDKQVPTLFINAPIPKSYSSDVKLSVSTDPNESILHLQKELTHQRNINSK